MHCFHVQVMVGTLDGVGLTCRAGSVMPLEGSWVVASMTAVTSKLGKATITNGHRQLVAGPADKIIID